MAAANGSPGCGRPLLPRRLRRAAVATTPVWWSLLVITTTINSSSSNNNSSSITNTTAASRLAATNMRRRLAKASRCSAEHWRKVTAATMTAPATTTTRPAARTIGRAQPAWTGRSRAIAAASAIWATWRSCRHRWARCFRRGWRRYTGRRASRRFWAWVADPRRVCRITYPDPPPRISGYRAMPPTQQVSVDCTHIIF